MDEEKKVVYPPKILKAINTVMKAASYVKKEGKNKFFGYSYAGEADVLKVFRPAIVDAGLIIMPEIADHTTVPDSDGNVFVIIEFTLAHVDGDVWPKPIRFKGCGNDFSPKSGKSGDKALAKAITSATKYFLFKTFLVTTGDDAELNSPEQENGSGSGKKTTKQEPAKQTKSHNPPIENPPVRSENFTTESASGVATLSTVQITNLRKEVSRYKIPAIKFKELIKADGFSTIEAIPADKYDFYHGEIGVLAETLAKEGK